MGTTHRPDAQPSHPRPGSLGQTTGYGSCETRPHAPTIASDGTVLLAYDGSEHVVDSVLHSDRVAMGFAEGGAARFAPVGTATSSRLVTLAAVERARPPTRSEPDMGLHEPRVHKLRLRWVRASHRRAVMQDRKDGGRGGEHKHQSNQREVPITPRRPTDGRQTGP